MRMVFGTPQANGFFHWGFWEGATDPGRELAGILVDQNFNLTESGLRRQALMQEWDTDEMLTVGPDGTVDFNGFFGDYEITVDGETFSLTLEKGTDQYSLLVDIPPDFNDDQMVDSVDLGIWQASYGLNGGGDADGDGDTDGQDFLIWQDWFGFGVAGTLAAASVPEPTALVLLGTALLCLATGRMPQKR